MTKIFCWLLACFCGLANANAAGTRFMVEQGTTQIEVFAEGSGPVIVFLPSLGRGAEDYAEVSHLLAADGFRVLRPQPRGIGASAGPLETLTLHDFAADIAAVITHEQSGPAIVVGHAFGNFVGRMLATDRPDLVRGLVMAAASAGKVPSGVTEKPISDAVREAIDGSGNPRFSETQRLIYLQLAFFAPGNDPRVWLGGWYPATHDAEAAATAATPLDLWFAGGGTRILDLQAEDDTVAPRKFAGVMKAALGDRVQVVVVPHAGHALIPEQPQAVAGAIATFARAP